ncbi:LANO_0C03444g1_1 [Lachancea nothofagi CBS 11611]|uniref:LANO_0C03444g1_1 n=1 Tax=Lachancea nothofagi CBS 11611 TaxID=1266666 RepID=A0A1G4J600_9SACH|nr:LANO_0C03444g1_1 [Lachancea nothofagi CBS 11611]
MVKQKVTSKSSKRYRYSSFKDKIDNLRIEPARDLTKRVHDHVETSHFLASFDHWDDINMSAGFTSFADDVRPLVQTLPQILFHEKQIFEHLHDKISQHDENSLQPLLDLLAQFCHDLGPDFMQFYEKTMRMLTALLDDAINFESSNVFEWGFNCVAYIYKYLSRILAQDLLLTYNLLFPLFSHNKEYLSRFSAEVLSFLVRKAKQKSLQDLINHTFKQLEDTPDGSVYDGLLALFTETLTSTKESLHSKFGTIMETLVQTCLVSNNNSRCISLLADVIMNILRHVSTENAAQVYDVTLSKIDVLLADKHAELNTPAKILISLAYAESGRKVASWSTLIGCIQKMIKHPNCKSLSAEDTALLFCCILRNSPIPDLTQCHKSLFSFYIEHFAENFLEFFKLALTFEKDRMLSFGGAKFLQKFISVSWALQPKKIALFLLQLEKDEQLRQKLAIKISNEFVESQFSEIDCTNALLNEEALFQVYWRLQILSYSDCDNAEVLLPLLEALLQREALSDFEKDVIGKLLQVLTIKSDIPFKRVVNLAIVKFGNIQNSRLCVESLHRILREFAKTQDATLLSVSPVVLLGITKNLSLPDHKIRYESLKLILAILQIQGKEAPQILNDCKLIEEIPRNLQTARDVTMRIRAMGSDFAKIESEEFICHAFLNYLFGILTVRFSPAWEGVYEILPNIYGKDQQLTWNLFLKFIDALDEKFNLEYYEPSGLEAERDENWSVSISRLNEGLQSCNKVFESYFMIDFSIIELSKEDRSNLNYPGLIRNQALKGLLLIPQLAERHSRDIIPYFLKTNPADDFVDHSEAEEGVRTASTWSESDRKLLLTLVGKFKNIKAVFRSEEVFERLLDLLGSRTTEVQKLALDGLLAYRDKVVIKYRDNLKNLLDDTAFKDECLKLLSQSEEQIIESNDECELMPIILRILFGRAQTPVTSGLKKSRKTAVITLLPSLAERYVIDFLKLASNGVQHERFYQDEVASESSEQTTLSLRRMVGFATLGQSAVNALGSRYPRATATLIDPVLYTIWASNRVSSNKTDEEFMIKQANNVRQISMKLMLSIFSTVGGLVEWDDWIPKTYKLMVSPRLEKFEDENLQQPSSLMTIISFWASDIRFYKFLYYDHCSAAGALMKTLARRNAKEAVVGMILSFANQIIKNPTGENEYVDLVSLVASSCLKTLPELLGMVTSQEVVAVAVDLLLNLIEAGYVHENETKKYLLNSLAAILEGGLKGIRGTEKVKVMQSIASLIIEYQCEWEDIDRLYKCCSKLYRTFSEKDLRLSLNQVFLSIGTRFETFSGVAKLLSELNGYSSNRMESYNFETVLPAFKEINEKKYLSFTEIEWLPIINSCLFYITDEEELAIRTNATYTLQRLVDYANSKALEVAKPAIELIRSELVPQLKNGLRNKSYEIQTEFISIVAYIVTNSIHYSELSDMKVLLFDGDEEANFFTNISHIQLHRRQRAIKRLGENAASLSDNSIAHFLIPMVEHYVHCSDEKYRNLCNESISTMGLLTHYVTWNQYKALMRRFVSMLEHKPQFLKETVILIVHCSRSLAESMKALRLDDSNTSTMKKLPKTLADPETFIKEEIYPKFSKILNTRDEQTIVARIPLCEAMVNFILGLDFADRASLLPGILSSVCQVLRSRSEELREAVRKSLANVIVILGPEYLTFMFKELKGALRRGSQIHILSYTIHSILMALAPKLTHKDLDATAHMIVGVIMEDVFGTAGQEKDAEGYTSKLKELKFNKSYDTGEILASNISLSTFGSLLQPIKALLSENLGLKIQRKLNELMRRYALGLNHNEESSSTDALTLCYEIFTQSSEDAEKKRNRGFRGPRSRTDSFFIINLNAKTDRVQNEHAFNSAILQKFSLDLLRTVLSRNSNLLDAAYLENFVPLLQCALDSNDEGVLISSMRVLIALVKLQFTEENEGVFKNCARKVLNVVKDSPSTSSELCQVGLKYLSSLIRYKDIQLKDTALSFILERIKPDLNEPNKQGLAFNFVKSLVLKHIILPELYDIVDTIAEVMVTNHSKEIRDVSRSVYYQFLMEYDQSRGRLEKQFKFLVSNLEYPSQDGRQSVMELVNLIVNKSSSDLLLRLSGSFFLSLSNVAANDSAPRCREMGSALLKNLLVKLGKDNVASVEKYIMAWLKQDDQVFSELGLRIYKIYMAAVSMGNNPQLDNMAISKAKRIISESTMGSTAEWNLIYTALNVLDTYTNISEEAFKTANRSMWSSTTDCLLYPHPWVRLISVRMVDKYIEKQGELETPLSDYEIQSIAYRIFRQLGALSVSESLATVAVKTLVSILKKWIKNQTTFISKDEETGKYESALDFALARIGSILRDEENFRETFVSKKACVQLFALIIQIMDESQARSKAEKIILPLFIYLEDDRRVADEQVQELQQISYECMELLQSKLSVSDFSIAYSRVKQDVTRRRYERRAKRATLAVTAPEAAARRKLKKHARSKDKRKHEKDENGFYRAKNKKRKF